MPRRTRVLSALLLTAQTVLAGTPWDNLKTCADEVYVSILTKDPSSYHRYHIATELNLINLNDLASPKDLPNDSPDKPTLVKQIEDAYIAQTGGADLHSFGLYIKFVGLKHPPLDTMPNVPVVEIKGCTLLTDVGALPMFPDLKNLVIQKGVFWNISHPTAQVSSLSISSLFFGSSEFASHDRTVLAEAVSHKSVRYPCYSTMHHGITLSFAKHGPEPDLHCQTKFVLENLYDGQNAAAVALVSGEPDTEEGNQRMHPDLPREIWNHIFSYCTPLDVLQTARATLPCISFLEECSGSWAMENPLKNTSLAGIELPIFQRLRAMHRHRKKERLSTFKLIDIVDPESTLTVSQTLTAQPLWRRKRDHYTIESLLHTARFNNLLKKQVQPYTDPNKSFKENIACAAYKFACPDAFSVETTWTIAGQKEPFFTFGPVVIEVRRAVPVPENLGEDRLSPVMQCVAFSQWCELMKSRKSRTTVPSDAADSQPGPAE